ncbi:MAG: hypothetical protein WC700_19350 [Gemmatimonadaceae bacterium]|jgi:hypothetical protein
MEPTFEIPAADAAIFASLPISEQTRLRLILAALKEIHGSESKQSAAWIIAVKMSRQGVHGRGYSGARLMDYYRRYTATRSWGTLVRRTLAIARTPIQALPAEFLSMWREMVARHHGNVAAAHVALRCCYAAGSAVPGYTDLPVKRGALPRGWSLANLRRYQPTKAERQLRVVRQSLN